MSLRGFKNQFLMEQVKSVHGSKVISKWDRQTYIQTGRHTYRLTDKHTEWQTYKQTERYKDRLADILTDWQTYIQTDRHTYRMTDIYTDWQIYIHTGRHIYRLGDIHTDWQTYIQTDRHTYRLTDIHKDWKTYIQTDKEILCARNEKQKYYKQLPLWYEDTNRRQRPLRNKWLNDCVSEWVND